MVNMLCGLIAYTLQPQKPTISGIENMLTFIDNSFVELRFIRRARLPAVANYKKRTISQNTNASKISPDTNINLVRFCSQLRLQYKYVPGG